MFPQVRIFLFLGFKQSLWTREAHIVREAPAASQDENAINSSSTPNLPASVKKLATIAQDYGASLFSCLLAVGLVFLRLRGER
jgi:hypothetical protein